MDNREATREFLASRRAKITPEESGLPIYGAKRRVPGLRRGEVAMLAGVSVEYYTRLERETCPAFRREFWTLWPGPSNSTTPNGPTSSIWPGQRPRAAGPAVVPVPRSPSGAAFS